MKTKIVVPANPHKSIAAQMAQTGLIGVGDLSLLTGVPVSQLTMYAKKGMLRSYDEYHGKRFFKFQEVMTWLCNSDSDDQSILLSRSALEGEMKAFDCPFALNRVEAEDGSSTIQITWKELQVAA